MSTLSEVVYTIHPIAELQPKATAEEYLGTKANVKAEGFKLPVTLWNDGQVNWLIDGRTRAQIEQELKAEGVTQAANGCSLDLEVSWFQGSKIEALRYAESLNTRRNLSPSQRGAVAVRSGLMIRAMQGSATDETVDQFVERIAAQAQCSKTTVYACAKIAKAHPDLNDRIATGELSPASATKIFERRSQGLPDEETPTEQSQTETPTPGTPGTPGKPKKALDAFKREVHESFVDIFSVRAKVSVILKDLNTLMNEITEVVGGPGGLKYAEKTVMGDLRNARRYLKDYQPHIVCPICTGSGKVTNEKGEQTGEKCLTCAGHRYIDSIVYKALPAPVRALYEEASGPNESADGGNAPVESAEVAMATETATETPAEKPSAKRRGRKGKTEAAKTEADKPADKPAEVPVEVQVDENDPSLV